MESETDSDAGEPEPSGAQTGTADRTLSDRTLSDRTLSDRTLSDSAPFAPIEPPTPAFDAVPPPQAFDTAPPTQAFDATPAFASAPPPYSPTPPPPYPPTPPPPYPGAPGQFPPNAYGYPPYSYGYPHPQPPRGTNGMAIAALVLGICGFFFVTPIVGLVLGIVSLSVVNRTGQRGKGMAISGIVLSSLWIALFATVIVVAGVTAKSSAQRNSAGDVVKSGTVPVFDLRPGDCFTVPGGLIGSTNSKIRTLPAVPCSTPHDSEAFGSFTAAETAYPGANVLRDEARSQCIKLLEGYVPDVQSLPTGSVAQYLMPNSAAWDQGEHRVECFEQFPSATITGSMHRDASSYTAEQQRYLDAFRLVAAPAGQLNASTADTTVAQYQQDASNFAAGLQNEIAALTSAPWSASAQPSVDAMVMRHRDAEKVWAQAATDQDIATFQSDARIGFEDLDAADMKAVRDALGLTSIASGADTTS